MKLNYAGPKPLISHTGVEFDLNKEDKYVYINLAIQILKAIDHEYYEDRKYSYRTETARLSPDLLEAEVKEYCPHYDEIVKEQKSLIDEKLEEELTRIKESTLYTEIEKETYLNNYKMMYDYIEQRSINKRLYYCIIERLAEVVKKDNLDYIVTPMYQTFVHILHSIQGAIASQKFPMDTNLEIYSEDSTLYAKLDIINT